MKNILYFIFICTLAIPLPTQGEDWPIWGKNKTRNMVSLETDIPFQFSPGRMRQDESVDIDTTYNVRW
jgi:hypothetical protein